MRNEGQQSPTTVRAGRRRDGVREKLTLSRACRFRTSLVATSSTDGRSLGGVSQDTHRLPGPVSSARPPISATCVPAPRQSRGSRRRDSGSSSIAVQGREPPCTRVDSSPSCSRAGPGRAGSRRGMPGFCTQAPRAGAGAGAAPRRAARRVTHLRLWHRVSAPASARGDPPRLLRVPRRRAVRARHIPPHHTPDIQT